MNNNQINRLHGLLKNYEHYSCVQFLEKRIQLDEYRGIQLSEHNRYDLTTILVIVEEVYKVSEQDLLQIRTTDLSKRPYNIAGEEKYAEITKNIDSRIGRCTQDSLRKNLFVDMHRMGLIERYNNRKEPVEPYATKGSKMFVSLTDFAVEFMNASRNIFEQQMLFTRALETLMNGYGAALLDIMEELDADKLSTYEMTLFTSFLGKFDGNKIYTTQDIVEFIREFRNMSRFERSAIIGAVENFCNPNCFKGDKTDKRDWHNWINESQQISSLLGQMVYFDYSQDEGSLKLRVENGVFDAELKLKRSQQAKDDYFQKHNVGKSVGFELHHVVPLCWAKDANEFKAIDQWENLVYIDAYSHAKITQNRNKNVKLDFENSDAVFEDMAQSQIKCKMNENIIYNKNLQNEMLIYNEKLLSAKEN